MDARSHTNANMQPIFGTDNGNFVSWSPSNEFFGHEFSTATPLSPTEFLKFCNALSSEGGWPGAEAQAAEGDLKGPDSENHATGSKPDPQATEQVKEELSRLQKELGCLRKEMDDMRAWLEAVSKWSESTNDMLAAQGLDQLSPWLACQKAGCTCQYEGDIDDADRREEGNAH